MVLSSAPGACPAEADSAPGVKCGLPASLPAGCAASGKSSDALIVLGFAASCDRSPNIVPIEPTAPPIADGTVPKPNHVDFCSAPTPTTAACGETVAGPLRLPRLVSMLVRALPLAPAGTPPRLCSPALPCTALSPAGVEGLEPNGHAQEPSDTLRVSSLVRWAGRRLPIGLGGEGTGKAAISRERRYRSSAGLLHSYVWVGVRMPISDSVEPVRGSGSFVSLISSLKTSKAPLTALVYRCDDWVCPIHEDRRSDAARDRYEVSRVSEKLL